MDDRPPAKTAANRPVDSEWLECPDCQGTGDPDCRSCWGDGVRHHNIYGEPVCDTCSWEIENA